MARAAKAEEPAEYEHVRAHPICPVCTSRKPHGTVLCAACHHFETETHDGGYGPRAMDTIARLERWLIEYRSGHEHVDERQMLDQSLRLTAARLGVKRR